MYLVVSVWGCLGIWAFSFEKDSVLKREFGFYVVQASLECMVLLLWLPCDRIINFHNDQLVLLYSFL